MTLLRRTRPLWTPVRSIKSEAKASAYPSSSVCASCSTRASKWTPHSVKALPSGSFSPEVTVLLKKGNGDLPPLAGENP